MIYTVQNTAVGPRAFYDARGQEIVLPPGTTRHVNIDDGTLSNLMARSDLVIWPASFERNAPYQPAKEVMPPVESSSISRPDARPPGATEAVAKPPFDIVGHLGIGDNLHMRAIMREVMKTHDVWLHTPHFELYHDLIEQGLKLILRPTHLHAQAKTIQRERDQFVAARFPAPPPTARKANIAYPKVLIDQHGSILEAQFSCVGLKMPERPDFSLPIKPEWRDKIQGAIRQWNPAGKPLMVHRPIVVRNEWDGRSRNPDPEAYDALYRAIQERFFVVSVADLAPGIEWTVGPRQSANIELHKGELAFPELAALFAEADLVFCNAGFAPVLAQAVGTPAIVVYGGRESYRTTQRVGAHLARTLPIDPINPCDCHSNSHGCDKRIDVAAALPRVRAFAEEVIAGDRRTLLFGTFYVDSPDRSNLTDLWMQLHAALNGEDCDILAVDSQSPIQKFADWTPYDGKRHRRMVFNFPDNIGHLSRRNVTAGRDGWGRAFCKGLEIACDLGYEHVVHIEGDSLFRLKVADVVAQMKADGIDCATVPVTGMRIPGSGSGWIETGLMFFTTAYIKRSHFIKRYDWPNRQVTPTPERYINQMLLLPDLGAKKKLRMMPWKALRADKNQITVDNIRDLDLDWVTHQHDSSQQGVYNRFVEAALSSLVDAASAGPQPGSPPTVSAAVPPKEVMPDDRRRTGLRPGAGSGGHDALPQSSLGKLNLGCGTNRLEGWANHDADVDITKPLPWPDGSVSHIVIEHCVEHVPYKAAIEFFKEACRVLAPGGVLRVTVPSLEQIAACDDASYFQFTTKWQPLGVSRRGAMHAIIYAHGHEMVWNVQLLWDTLYFAGFNDVRRCTPGQSEDPILVGVEGHGKIIGDRFNLIESCTCEARKGAGDTFSKVSPGTKVAIVVGGAECWAEDLAWARRLTRGCDVEFFYVNDHIKSFPERGVACTLHPDKLNGHVDWLGYRRRLCLPEPIEIWANRRHPVITHDTASAEWQGSSGLFAVQVARRKGHRKIIACGIPMTVDGGHFERHMNWQSAIGFRSGWNGCRRDLADCFRSVSGWTAEQFGKPDEAWLMK